jgi:hypothetical protein
MAFVIHYLKNDILKSIFNDDCLKFINKEHLEKSMHKVGLKKVLKKTLDDTVSYQGLINEIFIILMFSKIVDSENYILDIKNFGYYCESKDNDKFSQSNIVLHSFNDKPSVIQYKKGNISTIHYTEHGIMHRENGNPSTIYMYGPEYVDSKIVLVFPDKKKPLFLHSITFDNKKNNYDIKRTNFRLNDKFVNAEQISEIIDRFKSLSYSDLMSGNELVTEDELNLLLMYFI